MKLLSDQNIQVGKLGEYTFSQGYYIYVGSAKRVIQSRINRHLKMDKTKRWHMDYLRPYVTVTYGISFPLHLGECHLRRFTEADIQSANYALKGFGSSDCKCISHLLKLTYPLSTRDYDEFRRKWQNSIE